MVLFFDTETTGLKPGKIAQLSYIIYSDGSVCGKNFYFAVDYVEPSAQAVHGLSKEKLFALSGGKVFSDHADEIYDDFAAANVLVAHNAPFDISFMRAEFSYIDRLFSYQGVFDTMRYFTDIIKLPRLHSTHFKFPKLSELKDYAEVYDYDVTRFVMKNFGDGAAFYHDARFDTAAMYLSCVALKSKAPEMSELLFK